MIKKTTRAGSNRPLHTILITAILVAAMAGILILKASWTPGSSSAGTLLAGRQKSSPRSSGPEASGVLPDGASVFDDQYPGIANLDADLLRALRRAAEAADDAGVEFRVNSGWRSPEYQERLLSEAVATYGSKSEAARWVATATTSPHVAGKAADIGGPSAAAWLAVHGSTYGLCQIYRNEPWHFELRRAATKDGCPSMYRDPRSDPRMAR